MFNKVLIPGTQVGNADLGALVSQIAKLKDAEASVEIQFVVTSNSAAVLGALRALFGDATVAAETKAKRNADRVQKRSKLVSDAWQGNDNGHKVELKPGPERQIRSIEIKSGPEAGQRISRRALNERLAEKTIEEGTQLHSPKYGDITVTSVDGELVVKDVDGITV